MSRLLNVGSKVLRNLSPSRVIERLSWWRSINSVSPSLQARATFNSELAAKFFPIQISGVLSLVAVCLVLKLPADWLNDPLIAVLCLLTVASFLSLYSLLLPSGGTHITLIISIVLTMVALGIAVGTCVAYLISLQLATTQARKGDVGEPSANGIDKTTAPIAYSQSHLQAGNNYPLPIIEDPKAPKKELAAIDNSRSEYWGNYESKEKKNEYPMHRKFLPSSQRNRRRLLTNVTSMMPCKGRKFMQQY